VAIYHRVYFILRKNSWKFTQVPIRTLLQGPPQIRITGAKSEPPKIYMYMNIYDPLLLHRLHYLLSYRLLSMTKISGKGKKARSFSGCKCCKQAKRKCPEERPQCSICEKL